MYLPSPHLCLYSEPTVEIETKTACFKCSSKRFIEEPFLKCSQIHLGSRRRSSRIVKVASSGTGSLAFRT